MSSKGHSKEHRRAANTVKQTMRALNNQLSLLNHRVASQVELKDVDLDCYDLITSHGPLSPSAVAKRAGLHPATVTGILDRLERGGWVIRERGTQQADRRAVSVRALRDRNAELFGIYAPMNAAMDEVCSEYTEDDLQMIAGFLRKSTDAGRTASERLGQQ